MTITEFLSQFYPDPNEPICLRSFDPKGLPKELASGAQKVSITIDHLKSNPLLRERLKKINETQGLYFVVNAGGDKNEDITRINAIYCEMDMDVEPDDSHILKQHDMYDYDSPLMPSLRINTRKSVHAYWLPSEPMSNDDFLDLQQGLIKFFGSDPAISNLARVMRVPFFNHVHYENGYHYQRITHHTFRPDMTYTLAELKEAFPYKRPKKITPQFSEPSGRMETLDDVKAELRRRVMDDETWKAHGKWGCANAKCHNGEGPTGIRVDLASGAVTCWSNCDLKKILDAYGLELPKNRKFDYIGRPAQRSELYHWLQKRKK